MKSEEATAGGRKAETQGGGSLRAPRSKRIDAIGERPDLRGLGSGGRRSLCPRGLVSALLPMRLSGSARAA